MKVPIMPMSMEDTGTLQRQCEKAKGQTTAGSRGLAWGVANVAGL